MKYFEFAKSPSFTVNDVVKDATGYVADRIKARMKRAERNAEAVNQRRKCREYFGTAGAAFAEKQILALEALPPTKPIQSKRITAHQVYKYKVICKLKGLKMAGDMSALVELTSGQVGLTYFEEWLRHPKNPVTSKKVQEVLVNLNVAQLVNPGRALFGRRWDKMSGPQGPLCTKLLPAKSNLEMLALNGYVTAPPLVKSIKMALL